MTIELLLVLKKAWHCLKGEVEEFIQEGMLVATLYAVILVFIFHLLIYSLGLQLSLPIWPCHLLAFSLPSCSITAYYFMSLLPCYPQDLSFHIIFI